MLSSVLLHAAGCGTHWASISLHLPNNTSSLDLNVGQGEGRVCPTRNGLICPHDVAEKVFPGSRRHPLNKHSVCFVASKPRLNGD